VTPIFLSMGHFLYRFSTFAKKCRKSIENKFEFFANVPSENSVHLTSSLSCVGVSNASLRIKVCENDGNI